MKQKTAASIVIEWSDGTESWAYDEHAAEVMAWWESCELMTVIHGGSYKGKPLHSSEATASGDISK